MTEEWRGTIPQSVQVMVMVLMCSRVVANPTAERGKPLKRHKKKNKNPKSTAIQTDQQKD